MRLARCLGVLVLLGCGGGAAEPAASEEPAATEDTAGGEEPSLDAELRAAWAEFRAALGRVAEGGPAEDFFALLGQPVPEDLEAQREQVRRAAEMILAIGADPEGASTVRILHEGDRAALIVEQETCEEAAPACDWAVSIMRFERAAEGWVARGPSYTRGMRTDSPEPREARLEEILADPRFALDAPPPRPREDPPPEAEEPAE